MFERYTEKARRVIFFARYEASQYGSPYIETEHILMGILREDKALTNRLLRSHGAVEKIRKEVEAHTPIREKTSTSVDLPLSNECKRVLASAAEEMDRLSHRHLGPQHLLVGILREEKSFGAALLNERGVTLAAARADLERGPDEPEARGVVGSSGSSSPAAAGSSTALSDFARDLTLAATEGHLDALIGREAELGAVLEILCRRFNRSVLLIGERGVGKSAIVEGLAQRIAGGAVAPPIAGMRVMVIDGEVVASWARHGRNAEERANLAVKALIEATDTILFIEDLETFIEAAGSSRSAIAGGILKHWLLRGKLVCVGACTQAEYGRLIEAAPWTRECFSAVHVRALDEGETRHVLESRKGLYESFHGVTYADDALAVAASSSSRYLSHKPLPGKALELLDAAAARVKSRQGVAPPDVAESMKQLKVILGRMESAIANHEFEKARFYSDEERKERDNLRSLWEKHGLNESSTVAVTRQDVEDVIEVWSRYPHQP